MASTRQMRDWWSDNRCTYGTPTNMFGRTPIYAQETEWVRALEQAHYGAGYVPTAGGFIGSRRFCPAGIGGQTCQDNGTNCSLHNYGLAWDIEYNYNPHFRRRLDEVELWELNAAGRTKYTPPIVDIILGVETLQGARAFTWLGYSIGDTMHWQYNRPPSDRLINWATVPNTNGEGEMRTGDQGINVEKLQNYLNRWIATYPDVQFTPVTEDGVFGLATEEMCFNFQRWAGIEPTGRWGWFDGSTMSIAIKADTGS